MKLFSNTRLALLPAALTLVATAASAVTITGTVTDRTTNKVVAGDAVVLIGFGQGMQETGRTTTDAHGRYTLDVPDSAAGAPSGPAGGMHLIRVDHQKAAYFQPAPPGAHAVDVDVYDVQAVVKGISIEADVLNIETTPPTSSGKPDLHVIESYFVKNNSQPAMTQFSKQAFEIYLPAEAQIDATAAMGPGGMPVSSSPMPMADKGHYAFVFPVRPGETRFQISYHLPYTGSYGFAQKVAIGADHMVVIVPKSMQFQPKGTGFQTVPDSVSAQTYVNNGVPAMHPVEFTVVGTGQRSREAQGADAQNGAPAGAQAGGADAGAVAPGGAGAGSPDSGLSSSATDTRPGGGLGAPIDTPDALDKYKAWILSGLALALVIAAAFMLRRKPGAAVASAPAQPVGSPSARPVPAALRPFVPADAARSTVAGAASQPFPHAAANTAALLPALKDALFALESERLEGKRTEAEYEELKAALDTVLRKTLVRNNGVQREDAPVEQIAGE